MHRLSANIEATRTNTLAGDIWAQTARRTVIEKYTNYRELDNPVNHGQIW